ncbi:MAG: type III secretion protein [Chlamydiae bacterium]|nr:type III secretion protein [Chlamydiota bacterium]
MSQIADYTSFYAQLGDYAPMSLLTLFFLSIARLIPVLVFAPFFGSKMPSGVKMGLAISLSIVMLPRIIMQSQTAPDFTPIYIFYFIKELFIGFLMAIIISVPFYVALSAGSLIDFLRGSSALQVSDPSSQEQTSPIGILYNYMLIAMFYMMNGPILFFQGFLDSYSIIPADGFINPLFFSMNHPIWVLIMGILAKVIALSIQLSAPCLLAILMTEVFLGIANRLAPQVQIVFLGMSLKSLIGLAVLCAAWVFILQQLGKETFSWMKDINRVFQTLSM